MSVESKNELNPAGLDLYRLRDELAHSYNPANAVERMLVSQMTQCWERLQRALDAEHRYLDKRDLLDVMKNDYDMYKTVTRYVADCERAWRHALLHLEKTQRRRQVIGGFSPNARRRPVEEELPVPAHATTRNIPASDDKPVSAIRPVTSPGRSG